MTAVLVVAGISAVAGLILGLYRLAWFTLVIPSLLIVIVAVVVLLYNGFGLLAGVAITFGCLALNQIAYLIGAAISILGFKDPKDFLSGDPRDDQPNYYRLLKLTASAGWDWVLETLAIG
jgi:hypothetical protein